MRSPTGWSGSTASLGPLSMARLLVYADEESGHPLWWSLPAKSLIRHWDRLQGLLQVDRQRILLSCVS